MRDAAAEGAFVADGGMRDMRRGFAEQRRMLCDQRIGHCLAMPGQRADAQPFPLKLDTAKRFNMRNIDQDFGSLQAQGKRRHETLAARDIARILARISECLKRLGDRDGPHIAKCSGLQNNPRFVYAPRIVTIWS